MDTNSLIQTALEFISKYPWFGVFASVVALASSIAAATPTPKAGTTLSYVYKVIDLLALNIGKAKQK